MVLSPWHCVIHEILPRTKQGKMLTLLSRAKLFMPDSAKAQDDHSMNGPESLALCHSRNPPTDQARKDADTAKPGKAVLPDSAKAQDDHEASIPDCSLSLDTNHARFPTSSLHSKREP